MDTTVNPSTPSNVEDASRVSQHAPQRGRLIAVALVIFFAFYIGTRTSNLNVKAAWSGFSPIGYVYDKVHSENFEKDWPSGVGQFDKSIFMRLYPYMYESFGVPPEVLLPIVIGVHVLLLSLAYYFLARAMTEKAGHAEALVVVLLAVASGARDVNLARWGTPFFAGQFYATADILRIFAMVCALRGRVVIAGLLIGITFAVHPTMGIMGGVAVAAMFLVRPLQFNTKRFLLACACCMVVAVGWTFYTIDLSTVGSGIIGKNEWFHLTRLTNYHWYPVSLGVFDNFDGRLLGFVSVLALFVVYLPDTGSINVRRTLAGIGAALGMTLLGILISTTDVYPTLVKLCLVRASEVAVMLALTYPAIGLFRDMSSASLFRQVLAALILLSAFVHRGFDPLVTALLTGVVAWESYQRTQRSLKSCCLIGMVLMQVSLFVYLHYKGHAPGERGFLYVAVGVWLMSALYGLKHRFQVNSITLRGWGATVCLALLIGSSGYWVHQTKEPVSAEKYSYMDAQVWARNHTPIDSLFMTDPTICYGWRDFSRRSSFGNQREWAFCSWLYESDARLFEEGLQRLGELSVDPLSYPPNISGTDIMNDDVQRRYYETNDAWRRSMSQRYGITHYVLRKELTKGASSWPVVYENEHFTILEAPTVMATRPKDAQH